MSGTVPHTPSLSRTRRSDRLGVLQVEHCITLYDDDPGLIPGLQNLLQDKPVVGVHVHRQQVELITNLEPLKQLHDIIGPEHDLLEVDAGIFMASIQQER